MRRRKYTLTTSASAKPCCVEGILLLTSRNNPGRHRLSVAAFSKKELSCTLTKSSLRKYLRKESKPMWKEDRYPQFWLRLFVGALILGILTPLGCGGGGSKGGPASSGSGGTLSFDQRSAAMNAISQKYASLPHQDLLADNQTLLTYVQSRSEFDASGLYAEAGTIWAHFRGGQTLLIVKIYPIPTPTVGQSYLPCPPVQPTRYPPAHRHFSSTPFPRSPPNISRLIPRSAPWLPCSAKQATTSNISWAACIT